MSFLNQLKHDLKIRIETRLSENKDEYLSEEFSVLDIISAFSEELFTFTYEWLQLHDRTDEELVEDLRPQDLGLGDLGDSIAIIIDDYIEDDVETWIRFYVSDWDIKLA